MSEIVASVYDCMETTGCSVGILFIDEINCVSETLAPVMLQLLQNKTFGSHRIPEGWLIVAAGNPPEYNKSVRDFDIVTLDRVRRIDVEADLTVWKQYARENRIHPCILAFLNLYPDSFYLIRTNGEEPSFVTARGWEDLSRILTAYEQNRDPVSEEMMSQYLQEEGHRPQFCPVLSAVPPLCSRFCRRAVFQLRQPGAHVQSRSHRSHRRGRHAVFPYRGRRPCLSAKKSIPTGGRRNCPPSFSGRSREPQKAKKTPARCWNLSW